MGITAKVDVATWKRQFQLAKKTTERSAEDAFQKAAQGLYNKIVSYTPIGDPTLWNPPYWPKDYTPGELKDSWVIENNGLSIDITNSQPYAVRVEYGWSTQAPYGMMRRAIADYPQILGAASTNFKI